MPKENINGASLNGCAIVELLSTICLVSGRVLRQFQLNLAINWAPSLLFGLVSLGHGSLVRVANDSTSTRHNCSSKANGLSLDSVQAHFNMWWSCSFAIVAICQFPLFLCLININAYIWTARACLLPYYQTLPWSVSIPFLHFLFCSKALSQKSFDGIALY